MYWHAVPGQCTHSDPRLKGTARPSSGYACGFGLYEVGPEHFTNGQTDGETKPIRFKFRDLPKMESSGSRLPFKPEDFTYCQFCVFWKSNTKTPQSETVKA